MMTTSIFQAKGKERYLVLMNRVMDAYPTHEIQRYLNEVKKDGISEHGFPRLTANLGILLAHGYRLEEKDLFLEMMDLCCAQIPVTLKNKNRFVGSEFSVKEVLCCIAELEKTDLFDKETITRWKDSLKTIDPYRIYAVLATIPPKRIGNWAAFSAASEQVRKFYGLSDESAFIENQLASQLLSFDENGMYRDPNEPIVYDLVTRLQIAIALAFGYDGPSKAALEAFLIKSENLTLEMQSVTGEIPYGGRSNQFLHTETTYAALCEFYAAWLNKRGEKEKAGMFRRSASRATECLISYLSKGELRHIKNDYPIESQYGCENYAYFDKYMITCASWLYLAYFFMDESIEEMPCPSEKGDYIFETSPYFHKVWANHGGYFVETDTAADPHYDATGLGRIQKMGAPSAICMSLPVCHHPNFILDMENPSPFSICGGVRTKNGFVYAYDEKAVWALESQSLTEDKAEMVFAITLPNGQPLCQTVRVEKTGVTVTVEGAGELALLLPLFDFDGKTKTEIKADAHTATVTYQGWQCRYTTEQTLEKTDTVYANRNGHYIGAAVYGKDALSLQIELVEL